MKFCFAPFDLPPFAAAQRTTGLVATQNTTQETPTATTETTETNNNNNASKMPSLQRRQSMSGNVLLLETTDSQSTEKKAYLLQRKLEQHTMLGITTLEGNTNTTNTNTNPITTTTINTAASTCSCSTRVGYPLQHTQGLMMAESMDDDEEDDNNKGNHGDDKNNHNNNDSSYLWNVPPQASWVAIHVYTPLPATANHTPNKNVPLHLTTALPNPLAEWHVWHSVWNYQQQQSNDKNHDNWLVASTEMGRQTADGSTTAQYYFCVSQPTHQKNLWDDLLLRGCPYTEDEAKVVFGQLLQLLQQLRHLHLWHRNITLHNLVYDTTVGESETDVNANLKRQRLDHSVAAATSTTTTTTTTTSKQQRRIQLSKHGWALPVVAGDDDDGNHLGPTTTTTSTTTTTTSRIPPPPCTISPMYVAPEWLLWSTTGAANESTAANTTTTTPNENNNNDRLFALDLWSACICLLVLLEGGPPSVVAPPTATTAAAADQQDDDNDGKKATTTTTTTTPEEQQQPPPLQQRQQQGKRKSLLFVAPIPEDPSFAQLHARIDKWYGTIWSPELRQLLHGALHPDPQQRWTLEQVVQHGWHHHASSSS